MKRLRSLIWMVSVAVMVFANIAAHAQTPSGGPAPSSGVIFIDKAKVAEAFAKGGTLASASDLIVLGAHRAAKGQVEVHDKETDVIYVIEGAATFVTGGKMEGGKVSRPNQWIGNSIAGGDAHQLTKGDMIIVPAGTPHWFRDVSPQISYYVVKVVKP